MGAKGLTLAAMPEEILGSILVFACEENFDTTMNCKSLCQMVCTSKALRGKFELAWKACTLTVPCLRDIRHLEPSSLHETLLSWQSTYFLLRRMHPNARGIALPRGELVDGEETAVIKCAWRPWSKAGKGGGIDPSAGDVLLTDNCVEHSQVKGHLAVICFSGRIGGDRAVRIQTPWKFVPFVKPKKPDTPQMIYKKNVREQMHQQNPSWTNTQVLSTIKRRFGGKEAGGPSRVEHRELRQQALELKREYHDKIMALRRSAWTNPYLIQPFASGQGGELAVAPCRYFEISLLKTAECGGKDKWCVSIGFCTKRFKLNGRQPGWDCRSVAAHSDDGKVFCDNESLDRGMQFSAGDTVGVGLRLDDGDAVIFFTKNGQFLCWYKRIEFLRQIGNHHQWVKSVGPVDLYPVVGIDSKCPVEINNGSAPFQFDVIATRKLWRPLKGSISGTTNSNCISIPMEDSDIGSDDDDEDSDEFTQSDDEDDDLAPVGLFPNAPHFQNFFNQLFEAQDVHLGLDVDVDDDDDDDDSDYEDDEDDDDGPE